MVQAYVCDDKDKSHDTVQHNGEHDHPRNRLARVGGFLRHVHGSVRSSERARGSDRADEARCADGRPTSKVVEGPEDLAGGCLGRQDPQRDDDAEEAEDVHNKDDALENG